MANQKQLENVIASINISSMSKKVSSDFKGDVSTMTVYFTSETQADEKKLIDFGIREYTSRDENKDTFFVVKASAKIALFMANGQAKAKDATTETGTGFRLEENDFIKANFIKGEKAGQTFYRLQALQPTHDGQLIDLLPQNPFA